jgi:hypothetical protein
VPGVGQPCFGSSDPFPRLPRQLDASHSLILAQNSTTKYIYIVRVPKQPLGAHDVTLGTGMNTIGKYICMGLQDTGKLAPFTRTRTRTRTHTQLSLIPADNQSRILLHILIGSTDNLDLRFSRHYHIK